ncbi:MAG: holo-ACP synthase [Propionibacteriaceae bacterium]|nr:holo-ACP synthase [Propionibacteriaceae bacterium]
MKKHAGLSVSGIGVDLVHIPAFADQLAQPGTSFKQVFTEHEREACAGRPGGEEQHLAARWAGKEAVLKAWSSARRGLRPALSKEAVDLSEVEIRVDDWGRPGVVLLGGFAEAVRTSLGTDPKWKISLSHDGDYAVAVVTMSC